VIICKPGVEHWHGAAPGNTMTHIAINPNTKNGIVVLNYCAEHKILPEIQVIPASQINDAWDKVVNKQARYRYVIDAATI
jgi:D-arabinose 1-dehydrogenase-like Zn-dependent alcohol dehydrogenase